MQALKEWWIAYLASNLISAGLIWASVKKPMWCRLFLATFFLWATYFNSTTAVQNPSIYLTYARLAALPEYREFIEGFFSKHITVIVCLIALGQFAIAAGLVANKNWVRLACIGEIIFGLAIAPLGIGSGFPSTVSMAIAFFVLLRKYKHDFIWKINQYQISKQ